MRATSPESPGRSTRAGRPVVRVLEHCRHPEFGQALGDPRRALILRPDLDLAEGAVRHLEHADGGALGVAQQEVRILLAAERAGHDGEAELLGDQLLGLARR